MDVNLIETCIVGVNAVVTAVLSVKLYILTNIENRKNALDIRLAELQKLSFQNTFLEDKMFTEQWNNLRAQYLNNTLEQGKDRNRDRFLKYDVYTEMLFNFLEMSYKVYKKEKDLLNYIDFKSWFRIHSACWKNPLQEHSNREVYGKEIYDMVEDWLK